MDIENKVENNESEDKAKGSVLENKKMFLYGLFGFVGVAIVLFISFGIFKVYVQASTGSSAKAISTVLRLPLAKVDGKVIFYSEYIDDLEAITSLYNFEKELGSGQVTGLTSEQMSDQVIWRFINNIFINKLAKTFDIKIEQSDIDELKEQLISQFSDKQAAEQELLDRYGWTLDAYEHKVIKPFILQKKLIEEFNGQDIRENVRIQAEKVLEDVKNGASFEEKAKKYSQDSTANNGGDLGWFGKGEMVTQFEAASFAMEKGELLDNIVETVYGYHIIRLEDRKTEKVDGNDVEKVKASHIFFRFPSLDESIQESMNLASVNWYVKKIGNPLKEFQVLESEENNETQE